jgi:uncharacterized protein
MKQEPKIVLDTNIWISALLWGGKPSEIVDAAKEHRVAIFVSEEIVAETSRVLNYPKLRIYEAKGLTHENVMSWVLRTGKMATILGKVKVVQEHPADDKFIECALAADADYIISGDKHLLRIANYKKIRVLSANDFLQIIETKNRT